MKITYFSWLRTKAGVPSEDIDPPGDVETVGDLMAWLADRRPALKEIATTAGALRCTVNRRYVEAGHRLQPGDEVAVFPPVTGG